MDESLIFGLLLVILSSVLFGSMFVPIRKFTIGDGLFVQWIMGVSIFIVGLLINIYLGSPPFYLLAVFAGALWTLGNAMALLVVQFIGMGIGMHIWDISNLVSGWAAVRFGWFGLTPEVPLNVGLNYAAVATSLLSGIVFIFVKSHGTASQPHEAEIASKEKMVMQISPRQKQIIGTCLAPVAGVFFGLTFVPVIFIQNHRNETAFPVYSNARADGLSYVFPYTCGILLTSTILFLAYAIAKRNEPFANAKAILPAYLCGTMWGVAQAALFAANAMISMAVTYPVATRLPAIISALWGILAFREVTGKRNLVIFGFASLLTVLSGVLSGISNVRL